jgi:RNA polymerase sigma-70 factor (ECF subfamily)
MFATTRWSLIATAADKSDPQTTTALAELCERYWQPVYAFFRRNLLNSHTAEDCTQAFFARLLEKNDLAMADASRGRFRSFLLTACQHFLANWHDYQHAAKRGGHRLQVDFAALTTRFETIGDSSHESAERIFDRQWATQLLDEALQELEAEYAAAGKGDYFAALASSLAGASVPYEALASQLDCSIGAVKVAMHRLRQRYRERIREVIGRTVANPADIDEEVRDLFAALASPTI